MGAGPSYSHQYGNAKKVYLLINIPNNSRYSLNVNLSSVTSREDKESMLFDVTYIKGDIASHPERSINSTSPGNSNIDYLPSALELNENYYSMEVEKSFLNSLLFDKFVLKVVFNDLVDSKSFYSSYSLEAE